MATRSEHDERIAAMFDRIAPRYDRLNRVLSFGSDRAWRARAIRLARPDRAAVVLDVGAGTGDLSLQILRASPRGTRAVGLDLSRAMLRISRRRLDRGGFATTYVAAIGNAASLPLADGSVDRIVSGFTLRNIGDLPAALREMRRVLRPGGRAVLLELSHPPNALFRAVYRLYFERILPLIARVFGGDPEAYRYLPRSLRPFPSAERLAGLMREAGLVDVRFERLTLGIAAVHVGER